MGMASSGKSSRVGWVNMAEQEPSALLPFSFELALIKDNGVAPGVLEELLDLRGQPKTRRDGVLKTPSDAALDSLPEELDGDPRKVVAQ